MAIIPVLTWAAPPNVFAFRFPNAELTTNKPLIFAESKEVHLFKDGETRGPV